MSEIDIKREGIKKLNNPKLFIEVPQLRGYLRSLGRLNEYQLPPWRKLRVQRQAVVYIMGNAIVLGFVSVLWGQGKII